MTNDNDPLTLKADKLARKHAANRKWQAANRDKARGYHRKWRAANKEKDAEISRRWNEKNSERRKQITKRWRKANPDKAALTNKKSHIKKKYGITLAERDALLVQQGHKCAVCRSDNPGWPGDWMTDHCHDTGKVRGMLCTHCNRMLHSNVTPAVLRSAIVYLERSGAPSHDK